MSFTARTMATIQGLLIPWRFLSLSASFIPPTLQTLYHEHGGLLGLLTLLLFSPSYFHTRWFTNFWSWFGPNVRRNAGALVVPLLEGRTHNGRVVDGGAATGPGIGGVVMEIGAGSGLWVDVFSDDRYLPAAAEGGGSGGAGGNGVGRKRITRVYGIEPSADQHPKLRQAVRDAGLEDVYEIVPVGIEDLDTTKNKKWDGHIEKGSVDCIVSVLCLCSIPEPERNVRELYGYLKQGGRWYVYEHVRTEHSWYMLLYQRFINIFWPYFLGGCLLCRPTERTLREAGHWSKIDVDQPASSAWHDTLPHILGVFTK
ncbi:Uu.00g097830.m01.CDS01 [Anthostomella pinea]|uniref:Uu.00g097830.m01.CDS01 n=1 Tax=Anthostomella pinea TaxID=933095 RepID=A0AAI8VCC8_9PEZI|nr:Uu.00g097830.m01.CDS01 [Anthostomella pinea]